MKTLLLSVLVLGSTFGAIGAAEANCRIKNETKWSFTIESGNVSNQRVGSNTTTSIADGTIKGKADKGGPTISGSCKNGETVKIVEDRGVPVLTVTK
jgi:hypothetical protein